MTTLKPILRPSAVKSVSDYEVKDIYRTGNCCMCDFALSATLAFHCPNEDPSMEARYKGCSQDLMNNVFEPSSPAMGPLVQSNSFGEETITGLTLGHIQHHISTKLFPTNSYTPEVVAASESCLVTGRVDLVVYKREYMGLHPRVLFEFTVPEDTKKIFCQLFTYANNAAVLIQGSGLLAQSIGVIIAADRRSAQPNSQMDVFAYIPTASENGDASQLATVTIYKGRLSAYSLQCLYRLVHWVMQLERIAYEKVPPPTSRLRECVLTVGSVPDGFVFKSFDYQPDHVGVRRRVTRSHEASILFIENCEVVINRPEASLIVIKYPIIAGSHTATSTHSFIGVLRHLQRIHEQGYVHMDVRCANCVFCVNGEGSRLIDFDLSQPADSALYPHNFNPMIYDGARHAQALAGQPGRLEHDFYAMKSVMQLFKAIAPEDVLFWKGLCDRVGTCVEELGFIAAEIASVGAVQLGPADNVEFDPTGSPPLHKKVRR